jgi:probable rRNA maturation factor
MIKKMVTRATELAKLPLPDNAVVAVTFVGDRMMARINREYVGHTGTTDVISFCYCEDEMFDIGEEVAVELFICADTARREGQARTDSNYAAEMTLYLVHGLLHAAGEDDLSPAPRRRMRRREREVMQKLKEEFDFAEIFPEYKDNADLKTGVIK